MHDSARRAIARFYNDPQYKAYVDSCQVADMGSLNINGATRDIVPHCVGFDIVEGPGVDVVLKPGIIPPEHQKKYGMVFSINSFVFCPYPDVYKKQITDLLANDGLLFLTACSEKCTQKHSTSNNEYDYEDTFRVTSKELEEFFSVEFDILELNELRYEHSDSVLIGRLKRRV
ncbi:hypothetical protein hmeg3_01940 [Herbaspirillum sp. meg3]|uniref:hypothetical protein n=1 Tax=Herbaspirillum sp. meg3 TaxID=2025949 RepID=UPI000B9886C2|nr:hypothetical protein [Herbaspirillum sp. meg3]ASU37175.1 hypothetical protein hmeg3_01940 [Herbaspirillum sp. meg3]